MFTLRSKDGQIMATAELAYEPARNIDSITLTGDQVRVQLFAIDRDGTRLVTPYNRTKFGYVIESYLIAGSSAGRPVDLTILKLARLAKKNGFAVLHSWSAPVPTYDRRPTVDFGVLDAPEVGQRRGLRVRIDDPHFVKRVADRDFNEIAELALQCGGKVEMARF